MPQKRLKCFRLLFDHLAWIEHQFLSGIRDSTKASCLWGMMRGVGGVRKSLHQSWLAKGLGLGYYVEVLREFRKRFLGKRPTLFKFDQWHFHQHNTPVHNSILVTDYLTKIGIQTLSQPPYSADLAPCDFWLFPKLRDCRYETTEEMKEALTKSLTRSHKRTSMGSCRKCWNGTTCALQPEDITSKGTRVSCVLSIKVPMRKNSGNLFNDPRTYALTNGIFV